MTYSRARQLHLALTFIVMPVGALALMAFAAHYGVVFTVMAAVWFLGIEFATRAIKCPECRRPIGFGRASFFGIRIEWWKAVPAKACEYKGS